MYWKVYPAKPPEADGGYVTLRLPKTALAGQSDTEHIYRMSVAQYKALNPRFVQPPTLEGEIIARKPRRTRRGPKE